MNDWTPINPYLSAHDAPPANGELLVIFQGKRCVLERSAGFWLWGDGSTMGMPHVLDITHWMPLPALPTEFGAGG